MASSYKDELRKEADELNDSFRLSKDYRRRKFLIWCVRTFLTIIIYVFFWKYTWIRWTLVLYIPLSLFNLLTLLGWNFIVNRKIRKIKQKIDSIE